MIINDKYYITIFVGTIKYNRVFRKVFQIFNGKQKSSSDSSATTYNSSLTGNVNPLMVTSFILLPFQNSLLCPLLIYIKQCVSFTYFKVMHA